jgi:hypoxia up-regulated 1
MGQCSYSRCKTLLHVSPIDVRYGIDGNTDKFDSDRNVIFYDMGALSTKVSLVVFGSEPDKDRKNKTIGNLAVKAVAWDATLGGAAFTSKLFDILVAASKRPVETARAKSKVWKEAEKVKQVTGRWSSQKNLSRRSATVCNDRSYPQVLSANNEFTAMIEGLVDEYDFKHPVTRAGLIAASADLLSRVLKPVEHVLREAELKPEDIHAVEIVGGGVRIPAVQEALKAFFGKGELQKGLDGDEAACLGSALYAASLSTVRSRYAAAAALWPSW